MKTYDEYMDNIQRKAKAIKKRRRIIVSSVTVAFVLSLALTLFWPYQQPSVKKYKNSPYYQAIQGVHHATYKTSAYKNNYQWLKGKLSSLKGSITDGLGGVEEPGINTDTGGIYGGNSEQSYVETTDNQVEGVIEGDLLKRSDNYLYYLRNGVLSVYSIEKEDSQEISRFEVFDTESTTNASFVYPMEMYLSSDCRTLTVIAQRTGAYHDPRMIIFTTLDVSDPEHIIRTNQMAFVGHDYSARMVGDAFLLTYQYDVNKNAVDYDKPATFVPVYGSPDDLQPMDADDIYCPENPINAQYTVVVKLNANTLEVKDIAALFSYSKQVYVSKDNIYLTSAGHKKLDDGSKIVVTEITGICYSGEGLKRLGMIQLDGSVRNQYSMDEFEGILRVATSTCPFRERFYNEGIVASIISNACNCNLYCIDLKTWDIVSSVIGFAPEGEEVTSARFDGINAYICTADMIQFSDPVYVFDLSDVNNITYKHTPVIDGYSSSLINFGDYLLGIGMNEGWGLKVEVYKETETGVDPVTAYERFADFSMAYKCYFIDRENNLIGLPLMDWNAGAASYVLLQFDGQQLNVVQEIEISGKKWGILLETIRADMIDGYLYILEDTLQVVKIA